MLQSLSKAISVSLQKLGRKSKSARNTKRLRTINEQKFRPKVKEWMDLMIKEIQKGLPKLKSKNSKLADWKHIEEQGNLILKPAILEMLGEGGKAVVERRILKQDRFDTIGVNAVKWAEKHAAVLVTEVTTETQKAIRAFIADGVSKGKSIPAISRELRPLVGLTTKQIIANANYEEWLIINRPEYSAKVIREMTDVKARRAHRYRAKLISQTETRRALNEGTFQGFNQMGIKKVEGVSSPSDSCDWCLATINSQVVSIDEARAIDAEAHPGCECAWVAAFKRPPKAYEVTATGANQVKITTINDALKDLPYRHAHRVEKYSIETPAQFNKRAPYFKNRPNVQGSWEYSEKTVHIKSQWVNKQVIFHETGHAVYETGVFSPAQKPMWQAWWKKAVDGKIKYPTEYALTNAEEFFCECYSHYYLKNYELLEPEIKRWFVKTFR